MNSISDKNCSRHIIQKEIFGFFILSFLISNNRFGEVSLMDLLLAWFKKFSTSCSSERSQEDMVKSIMEELVFVKLWIGF